MSEDEANRRIKICEGVSYSMLKQDNVQFVRVTWIAKVKAKRHIELTKFKVVDTHCPKTSGKHFLTYKLLDYDFVQTSEREG